MKSKKVKEEQADDELRRNLPLGVKLLFTLRGHQGFIGRVAWSPDGKVLASPSQDKTIRLWDCETGKCIHVLKDHTQEVLKVAFDSSGSSLASGGGRERSQKVDSSIRIWDTTTGELRMKFGNHQNTVSALTFTPTGNALISGGYDHTVKFWNPHTGLETHQKHEVNSAVHGLVVDPSGKKLFISRSRDDIEIYDLDQKQTSKYLKAEHGWATNAAIDSSGAMLVTGGQDQTVKIWDLKLGRPTLSLEGHTDASVCVEFSPNGEILASKGRAKDGTVRLWNPKTGACLAVISEPTGNYWMPNTSFHPHLPLIAVVGSDPGTPEDQIRSLATRRDRVIHIYEYDISLLLAQSTSEIVRYTSAKIVLVGDSGVGKTGLGWRLAHGEFKEHSSTHGQQFWLLSELCNTHSAPRRPRLFPICKLLTMNQLRK